MQMSFTRIIQMQIYFTFQERGYAYVLHQNHTNANIFYISGERICKYAYPLS
jgi:hypothetical protein